MTMANARQFMAARTAAWAKSGGWVNPYVTEGLVAMWNSKWNEGGGVDHNPSATTWKDLSGSGYDLTYGSTWNGELAVIPTSGTMASTNKPFDHDVKCIEMVFSKTSVGRNTFPIVISNKAAFFIPYGGFAFYPYYTFTNASIIGRDKRLEFGTTSLTYDGRIYRNGDAFPAEASVQETLDRTAVGIDVYATAGGYWHTGNIGSIRIYSRALTADEIAHNYAIDKALFGIP